MNIKDRQKDDEKSGALQSGGKHREKDTVRKIDE